MTAERLAEIEARANCYATRCYVCDAVARVVIPGTSRALCAACAPDVPGAVLPLVSSYADSLDLVAEVRRLTAALAAHARHTDAAIDGVRAMLPAALEIARREGAEAMRAAIVERLKEEYRFHRGRERDSKLPTEDRSSAWERGSAVDTMVVAVEELPLPLDAPGGES